MIIIGLKIKRFRINKKFRKNNTIHMQLNYHTYLKLSFAEVKLFRHIQFQANKKRKEPELDFLIDVQYFIQKHQIKSHLSKVKLEEIMTKEGSVFYPKQDRWDTILLKQNSKQTKSFLRIKCQISKKVKKFESKYFLNPSEESSMGQQDLNRQTQIYTIYPKRQILLSQNIDVIDSSIKDIEITIPLQKFFNQPYHIHQIGMDFYIPSLKKNKAIENNQTNQKIQSISFKKKQKQNIQRDGIIYFQLVYMPMIKNQLLLRNVLLKTKSFVQKCKLYVSYLTQVHSEKNKINFKKYKNEKQQQQNKSVPQVCETNQFVLQKKNSSDLQLSLEINEWQRYLNFQSFESPWVLPLTINNDLDQIQFSLQCEIKDKNKQQRGKQSSSKIKLSKIVGVDYFYNQKQIKDQISSIQMTCKQQQFFKQIFILDQNDQIFQIHFEYQLIVQGGWNNQELNNPSQENQTEEFEGIGSIAMQTSDGKFIK